MAITDNFNADKLLCEKIPIFSLPEYPTLKFIVEKDVTVIHVSFYNQGSSALTSAVFIKNGANTIVSSSATLAADTVEEKEGADLDATYKLVSDGSIISITAADQPVLVVITIESLQE